MRFSIIRIVITIVYISICITTLSRNSWAGGSALSGVAPRAESMQNAFTAVADDPSAIFYNPAGLSQIKGTEIDLGAMFLMPDLKYTNSTNNTPTHSTKKSFGPSLFASTDAVGPVYLGLGFYTPFYRSNKLTINAATGGLPNNSTLMRMDLAPTVAFQLGQYLSFGMGLVTSYVKADADIAGLKENSTGFGFTGQAGLLLKPHPRFKLGLVFRGPMVANLSGTGTIAGVGSDHFTLDMKFPATLAIGLAWQVTDPLLIAVNFDTEMWSYVQQVTRNYTNPIFQAVGNTQVAGEDSYRLGIGAMYKPWKCSEFRVGYSYGTAAVPADNMYPAQPDFDYHYFSVGYSHYYKKFRFDVGYEFDYLPQRKSNNALFPGNYSMTGQILMAGVSYHFGDGSNSKQ